MEKRTTNNKLLKCKWVIPCGSSSIDSNTNLLSLSNVIDEITLTPDSKEKQFAKKDSPVFVPINMDIMVMWEREEKVEGPIELNFLLQFISPEGKVLVKNNAGVVRMEPHHKRFRTRFQLNGIPIVGFGTYKFRVVSQDEKKTGRKIVCETNLDMKINQGLPQ